MRVCMRETHRERETETDGRREGVGEERQMGRNERQERECVFVVEVSILPVYRLFKAVLRWIFVHGTFFFLTISAYWLKLLDRIAR